jgi:hypothetical protein
MFDAAVYGLAIAFPLIGALTRRWLAVAFPLLGWPLFYVGLNRGWWFYGTGDGWQRIAVVLTLAGVVTTALAVGVAKNVRARPPTDGLRARFAKPS